MTNLAGLELAMIGVGNRHRQVKLLIYSPLPTQLGHGPTHIHIWRISQRLALHDLGSVHRLPVQISAENFPYTPRKFLLIQLVEVFFSWSGSGAVFCGLRQERQRKPSYM